MIKKIRGFFQNYYATMMEENSDNLKMYEVRTGIYSNVEPARLVDVGSAHCDLILKWPDISEKDKPRDPSRDHGAFAFQKVFSRLYVSKQALRADFSVGKIGRSKSLPSASTDSIVRSKILALSQKKRKPMIGLIFGFLIIFCFVIFRRRAFWPLLWRVSLSACISSRSRNSWNSRFSLSFPPLLRKIIFLLLYTSQRKNHYRESG